MSRKRISARRAKERATRDEQATIQASKSTDSFQNFTAKLGIGTDNMMSASTYGFNPISRVRTLLEWIHRGSWVGGIAVDVVADDMTRAGVELKGVDPEQMEQIEEAAVELNIWPALNDNIKWSRLYGGSLAVMLIDGQDVSTPLRLNTIKKGQFCGLLVLDRWMVEPTLEDLVTQMGPDMGLPKYYVVTADAPGLQRMKVHYSRCIRLEGIRLPYWQRVMENLWGISVLERLYDRMVAFDSATTGAAQLVYKSYLRTLKIEGLREIASAGGPAQEGLIKYVSMMSRFQGIEGVTMIDSKDEFNVDGHSAFSGLGDALLNFGQQLSGALQIPLVRLFGQSPVGLNSSGESDLRTYYDNIKQRQERDLKVGVTRCYRAIAASEGIVLDEAFKVMFRPLWQLSDEEKSNIAKVTSESVGAMEEQGIISRAAALKELRQSSEITGIFTNITDEDIDEAENEPPPIPESELGLPSNARVSERIDENADDPGEVQDSFSIDGAWNESDHPRAANGQFGTGSQSSSSAASKSGNAKLTASEKSAINSYSGDNFLRINNELRAGDISDPDVARIDSAIEKSDLGAGKVLYRGMTREAAKQLFAGGNIERGASISDPAFASTSLSRGEAHMRAIGGVMLKIETGASAKGLEMEKHSRNAGEKEVLLPRNAKMTIQGIIPPKSPTDPVIVRVSYGE